MTLDWLIDLELRVVNPITPGVGRCYTDTPQVGGCNEMEFYLGGSSVVVVFIIAKLHHPELRAYHSLQKRHTTLTLRCGLQLQISFLYGPDWHRSAHDGCSRKWSIKGQNETIFINKVKVIKLVTDKCSPGYASSQGSRVARRKQ